MSDFFSAMHIASSGMAAERTRMNVVASNLANASTTRTAEGGPYRRRDPVFRAIPIDQSFNGNLDEPIASNAHSVRVERIVRDTSPPRKVYQPDHPDADAEGYVSLPNVQVVEEMVNMITATRSYSACAGVLESIKQMARRAIDLIR